MTYRCVFNIAPAGAGKGTLSANLEDLFDSRASGPLTILSMSQLLRSLCRQDGGLVDDHVVINAFREAFMGLYQSCRTQLPFIYVDGFPRTPQQAEVLRGLFTPHEHQQCLIVQWTVSPWIAVTRQMVRWDAQKKDPALRRPDFVDDEAAAKHQAHHRLQIHHNSEVGILNVLQNAEFEIVTLNANGEPDEVCEEFLEHTGWPVDEERFFTKFKRRLHDTEDCVVV